MVNSLIWGSLDLFIAYGLSLIVVFLTSALSGVFGMAGGLVLLWFLLALFPAATAIAVHGVIQLTANASRAWLSRRFIVWRIVAITTVGVVVASLGLYLISYTPNAIIMSLLIGLMPVLVWMPKTWFHFDASRPAHALGCGLIAGGLSIAAGASGPLIDIFFIKTNIDRRRIVATKAMIQVLSHGIKIVFYLGATLNLGADEWVIIVLSVPFAMFGTSVGNAILQRLSDEKFRVWTRWIVTAIGAFYLAQGMVLAL